MQAIPLLAAKPSGPAIWYLTTGAHVVGPVRTELMLRGIASGKVPDGCYVTRKYWSEWRELDRIREVSAYYRALSAGDETDECALATAPLTDVSIEDFRGAEDVDDCFKIALELAVTNCAAAAGLVHRCMPPHVGLVTTHAYSLPLKDNLGDVLPWHDETREAALTGGVLLGSPGPHAWARATARRMYTDRPLHGMAVMPVRYNEGQQALLELGRYDHSFRVSDETKLMRIRDALLQRIDQLTF